MDATSATLTWDSSRDVRSVWFGDVRTSARWGFRTPMIPAESFTPGALVDLPTDRVIHLGGIDSATVADALDPLPPGAPAVSAYHVETAPSASDLVGRLLDDCERAARLLLPSWLPSARAITGRSRLDTAAVRAVALGTAAASPHFGPFLADLAEAALHDTPMVPGRHAVEVRAAGIARVLAASYARDRFALVVTAEPMSVPEQHALATACDWLTERGRIGIWLIGDPIPAIDRFPVVRIGTARPAVTDAPSPTRLRLPAPPGLPHPGSDTEKMLESALARCDWAHDRLWNKTWSSGPLDAPIRVDVLFPNARCVVEIDGPEHRRPAKFAADRQRDVDLQLAGYAVLRFTNEHVRHDVASVVEKIARYVSARIPVPTPESRSQ